MLCYFIWYDFFLKNIQFSNHFIILWCYILDSFFFLIKGPDNPTRQLLPIMITKCCSGDGERRKDKGCGGGPTSKTKLWWQSCMWKNGVCERGCVKDGVLRRWCVTKMVCERGCAKDGVPRLPRKGPRRHGQLHQDQARHPVPSVPRLPRKTKVDVTLCHACHAKRRWIWHCATPATQSAAASRATKTSPSAPPSAISATPAMQNEGGCEIVPRLPRETHVDVTKCHACHAKCRGVTGD